MGNNTEFERAVLWLSDYLTFDVDARINLFEVKICEIKCKILDTMNLFDPKLHLAWLHCYWMKARVHRTLFLSFCYFLLRRSGVYGKST